MDIKILSCFHKEYTIPKASYYFPIHVGKEISNKELNINVDNIGENISSKNPNYCELTAMYWAWKNLSCDVIGMCHYRRYFDFRSRILKFFHINIKMQSDLNFILNEKYKIKIINDLRKYDILLPKKQKYRETTVEEHYIKHHNEEDWTILKDVLSEMNPCYKESMKKYFEGKEQYICNMFVMKKREFDVYCDWLFSILFEVEKRICISADDYQKRVFGFMSERLLGLYVYHNKFNIKEIPLVFIE